MNKLGNVEVLLNSFTIDDTMEVTVYPVECPGKGRVDNFLVDDEGKPCCVYKSKKCPNFKTVSYSEEFYRKTLVCRVL